jgi:arylsulfatase A-like enzyme
LIIISDDLRPEIDATGFGGSYVYTPNLKALSEESVVFTRTYVQQALCAPSRNSFLSGMRPDKTKAYNFIDDFRHAPGGKNWTSMPQWFRERGWNTLGAGKIYHKGLPAGWDYPHSWDNKVINITHHIHNKTDNTTRNVTVKGYDWLYPSEPRCPGNKSWCGVDPFLKNSSDVNITNFEDTQTTNATIELMREASAERRQSGTPFFICAGFRKPHLQWRFPKEFLQHYPLETIQPPKHNRYPAGGAAIGFHQPVNDFITAFEDTWECFGGSPPAWNVTNRSAWEATVARMSPGWAVSDACTKLFRRGYWAAVSFLDQQVGLLIDELEALGETATTSVVFFGDRKYWHCSSIMALQHWHCSSSTTAAYYISLAVNTTAAYYISLAVYTTAAYYISLAVYTTLVSRCLTLTHRLLDDVALLRCAQTAGT